MNIAFWFIVIVCVAALWALLSPWFKSIGDDLLSGISNVKKEMSDDTPDEITKEDDKNE